MLKNGAHLRRAMQHLSCLSKKEFQYIFGLWEGEYYWNKFTGEFDNDAAKFICYLDDDKLELLFERLSAYANQERKQ